eukprot:CAMPEP_0178931268 /NCGR_PEP_ID=MMETSP0786-20121207/21815_1 /TAXON_ID=186022 /ORGANISM="Thalassionema frauenfeldii, Strain CCMP 1798" /LENGTH=226 /DNA_ID=CAMNT_0020608125 /DNA_START=136 /DNA_END=812 /DNA_ORIENTATION=+
MGRSIQLWTHLALIATALTTRISATTTTTNNNNHNHNIAKCQRIKEIPIIDKKAGLQSYQERFSQYSESPTRRYNLRDASTSFESVFFEFDLWRSIRSSSYSDKYDDDDDDDDGVFGMTIEGGGGDDGDDGDSSSRRETIDFGIFQHDEKFEHHPRVVVSKDTTEEGISWKIYPMVDRHYHFVMEIPKTFYGNNEQLQITFLWSVDHDDTSQFIHLTNMLLTHCDA